MTNNYFKEMIRLADSIADQAHSGQTDKIGRPYITHPRRVAVLRYVSWPPENMRVEAADCGTSARHS